MKKFEQFGKVIRDIRWAKGLSQAELAKIMKASGQEVSNCERGLSALPKEKLKRLIKKYNLPEDARQRMLEALEIDAATRTRRDFAKALKVGG